MRPILTTDSRTLWLGHAARPYSFACPTNGAEFALLLVVDDSTISPDEQANLSEQFVRAGCRHAVCFGPTSSTWDDSIDMVSVMDEVEGRAGPFVMTSWFDHDPLQEAVDFFADCTAFDEWAPQHFVAFVLGEDPDLERDVLRALLARFG
jgi:hypothetical protein